MLTRLEMQSAVDLTRKALRVYEAKGLLAPALNAKRQAVYRPEDVEIAELIKSLRLAGISIDQIEGILRPESTTVQEDETLLVKALIASATNAFTALEKLKTFSARREMQVHKLRHGGCWAIGTEAIVNKRLVSEFVSNFSNRIQQLGLDNSRIEALYQDETDEIVKVTCFKECDAINENNTKDLKRYFIPEGIYYSVKAIGISGNYSCFDGSYRLINQARNHDSAKRTTEEAIEIYLDYPHDQPHGKNFEAFLLS